MRESSNHDLSAFDAFARAFSAPSPDAAMRVACRKLLAECGLTNPPIPLKKLYSRLGIRCVSKPTLGAGTLRVSANGFEIWVNPSLRTWRRQRFTVAHEIAHVLLLRVLKDSKLICQLHSESAFQEMERLCNLGAAEILMPTDAIAQAISRVGVGPDSLQVLYDEFLVSYQSLLMRLPAVLPASAIMLWRHHARKQDESVAFRVTLSLPPYQSRLQAPWLPRGCTTKHLNPDIVSVAIEKKSAIFAENLELSLNGKSQHCIGIATILPGGRKDAAQLPLFDGIRVPDENLNAIHGILLLAQKSMADGLDVWPKLKRFALGINNESLHFRTVDGRTRSFETATAV